MEKKNTLPYSFGTHDGTFHADEVTACALLLLAGRIVEEKIFRSRDPAILEQCEYVCDVGGEYDPEKKAFDHHQISYKGELSSAGMVLRYLFSEGDFSEREFDYFSNNLIKGIDAVDNGYSFPPGFCSFSHVIANFTPIRHDATAEEENRAFITALHFTLAHLQRLHARCHYILSCETLIREAMDRDHECLLFDREISWQEGFFALGGENHPAQFLVMPAGSHWKLRGIPPSLDRRMEVRCPLPAEWAGLLEEDLKRASGIPGAVFCHKGRFVSVWETKSDALKALEYALEGKKEERE